jgi:bacterioferritin-associated ferredoxin
MNGLTDDQIRDIIEEMIEKTDLLEELANELGV